MNIPGGKLFLLSLSLVLFLYGGLQILYLVNLLGALPFFSFHEWTAIFGWIGYIAVFSGLALYKTPTPLLLAYGILRGRAWAYHGMFAGLAAFPILILSEYLWWGTFRLGTGPALFLLAILALTAWAFTRPWVKQAFGNPIFKFRSASGAIATLVLLLSLGPLLTSISLKIMFQDKANPPSITSRKLTGDLPEWFKPVHLMDCKLVVPADGHLVNYHRIGFSPNPWEFFFRGSGGSLVYSNTFAEGDVFQAIPFNRGSPLDRHRFFLTNQWNPLILTLRAMAKAQLPEYQIYEIEVPAGRGFLVMRFLQEEGKARLQSFFTIHNGERTLSGMAFLHGTAEIASAMDGILAALRFENGQSDSLAAHYFREGESLTDWGRKLDAQVALANAYYLMPHRLEYRAALESTLNTESCAQADSMESLIPGSE